MMDIRRILIVLVGCFVLFITSISATAGAIRPGPYNVEIYKLPVGDAQRFYFVEQVKVNRKRQAIYRAFGGWRVASGGAKLTVQPKLKSDPRCYIQVKNKQGDKCQKVSLLQQLGKQPIIHYSPSMPAWYINSVELTPEDTECYQQVPARVLQPRPVKCSVNVYAHREKVASITATLNPVPKFPKLVLNDGKQLFVINEFDDFTNKQVTKTITQYLNGKSTIPLQISKGKKTIEYPYRVAITRSLVFPVDIFKLPDNAQQITLTAERIPDGKDCYFQPSILHQGQSNNGVKSITLNQPFTTVYIYWQQQCKLGAKVSARPRK